MSVIQEPLIDSDWRQYFECRWRILRAPWLQPRGSERDELDPIGSITEIGDLESRDLALLPIRHLMIKNDAGDVIAVARIHSLNSSEAQIRYMAVDEHYRCRGLASKMLQYLECLAIQRAGKRIFLNARANAQRFYDKHGYAVIGHGELLFNQIAHVKMRKFL
ncbi:MAG: GNAT family N-acetyltransferase [Thiohalomonadales bacterium]